MATEMTQEQYGYDEYLRLWLDLGREPKTWECPGLALAIGNARRGFMRGWLKAREDIQ